MPDEHVIESIGRCRVVIRDGQVVEVSPPAITRCPLTRRFAFPVDKITPEAVQKNIESRISTFGMCSPDRKLYSDDSFVGFGASELISTAIETGRIDAAVIACDGAGTVVVTDPAMVQGIGGRMSGLVSTSPIPEVIRNIRDGGGIVPDPDNASVDPGPGIRAAHDAGLHRLAVTVVGAGSAKQVRKADPEAVIVVVHTTGIAVEEAQQLVQVADIVTACASKSVREICGPKALMQAGSAIPVFAMTQKGKDVIIDRLKVISHPLYVAHLALPVQGDNTPEPFV